MVDKRKHNDKPRDDSPTTHQPSQSFVQYAPGQGVSKPNRHTTVLQGLPSVVCLWPFLQFDQHVLAALLHGVLGQEFLCDPETI